MAFFTMMAEFIAVYAQLLTDKTATTTKNTELDTGPAHIILLIVSVDFRRWMIENEHIVAGIS